MVQKMLPRSARAAGDCLPGHVRWTASLGPLGFNAGDVNLYRYVGNNPSNSTDPSGLWAWRLGPRGEIFVVSEAGDTLNGLVGQGYDAKTINTLGKGKGIEDMNAKLAAGIVLDITNLLPPAVREVLKRQQEMDFEALRDRVDNTPGAPKDIPKGKTVGNCGIDWLQHFVEDEKTGRIVKVPYHDHLFGFGNCYGFVGLCLGATPPKGVPPQNFSLGALKGEGFAGGGSSEPGRDDKDYGDRGVSVFVTPPGGLMKVLTGGGKPTDKPGFGDVVLFRQEGGFAHAGFVLGTTRAGDVIILQKISDAAPCGISSVDHPRIQGFGKPIFYNR